MPAIGMRHCARMLPDDMKVNSHFHRYEVCYQDQKILHNMFALVAGPNGERGTIVDRSPGCAERFRQRLPQQQRRKHGQQHGGQ